MHSTNIHVYHKKAITLFVVFPRIKVVVIISHLLTRARDHAYPVDFVLTALFSDGVISRIQKVNQGELYNYTN